MYMDSRSYENIGREEGGRKAFCYEMLCVVGLVLYKVENETTLRRTSEVQTRARDKCSLLVT